MRLCFDDGPSEYTEEVLDILKSYKATAIFAVVGKKALANEDVVRRIVDEGHDLANHTMTHKRLTDLDDPEMVEEIVCCQTTLSHIAHRWPLVLRPPFVAVDDRVKLAADVLGLRVLSASSMGDYLFEDADELALHAKGYTSFLGLHDTHRPTVDALPTILSRAFA
jgi:peptidoglycan/xylan/chitin deacetylase (PgdA/CDA1 family)